MNIWNYIGKLILFRWLISKLGKKNKVQEDNCTNIITDSQSTDEAASATFLNDTPDSPAELDATEAEDELDDLDTFINDNPHTDYSDSNYHFGRYSDIDSESRYDWDDDYDQSFNDFLDMHDDYDIMDDF